MQSFEEKNQHNLRRTWEELIKSHQIGPLQAKLVSMALQPDIVSHRGFVTLLHLESFFAVHMLKKDCWMVLIPSNLPVI